MDQCPRCGSHNPSFTRECACGQRLTSGSAPHENQGLSARPSVAAEAVESVGELTQERSRELAEAYRNLVLCFAGQLLLTSLVVVGNLTMSGVAREVLRNVALWGTLGTATTFAYLGYRTAEAMGLGFPWVWAVGMFLPWLNVVTLLVLSSKATRTCRAAGISVGFLGPKIAAPGTDRRNSGAA